MNRPCRTMLCMLLACAGLLAACSDRGGEGDAELVTSAKTYIEKQDYSGAVIQLKSALQKNAGNREARQMLGTVLLETGAAPEAAIEFRKALELGASPDEVQPLLARAMLVQGQFAPVLQQFAALQLDEPKALADLRTTVATAYAALGERDKARQTVVHALQAWPQHADALLLQARIVAGDGDIAGALTLVERALTVDAKHLGALVFKGDLQLHGQQDREAALATYARAVEAQPRAVAGHVALIGTLLDKPDLAGARSRFEQLKALQPAHRETQLLEARFAFIDKNFTRTRELTAQLLRRAPDDARVLQLAAANELQLRSVAGAEVYLKRLVNVQPKARQPRQQLAQIYIRKGQPGRALEVLRPLIDGPAADSDSLTLAGEALLQTGDLAGAEAHYARAVKADPQATTARTALALGQVARGKTAAGFAELEAAAAADPGIRANMALVAARLRSKDIPGALRAIEALEKKQPESPVAHTLRGSIQLQKGDTAAATVSFEKALQLDPLYVPATTSLATIDLTAGHPERAQKRYEDLLRADPRNTRALLGLAELKVRAGASKDEVTAAIERAVEANPQEAGPRILLVNHLLAHGDAKAALTAAQQATSVLPDNEDVMSALGSAQLAAGETQQALATLGRVVAAQPNSIRAHMQLAQAYLGVKDYGQTRQTLRRVLKLDPQFLPAQRGLMAVAMAEGRTDDALAVARTMQKQRPRELVGFLAEAEIQISQQRIDLAVAPLKTAFEQRPETETAVRYHGILLQADRRPEADRVATAWRQRYPKDMAFVMYLGTAAMKRDEFAQAERHFRTTVERLPNDSTALNNLAYALVRQGKPESLKYATRANELRSDDPPLMDTLAAALAVSGRLPEAVQLQRKAVSLSKDAPLYRLHLAELLVKAGDPVAAKAELESLRRLGGRFDRQAEVTALLARL